MKRSCILISLFLFTSVGVAQTVPYLSARVMDEAGILSSQAIYDLENQLKDHEKKTSDQVVILTVAALEEQSIEEFSISVVETWKLGQQDKDNGVLLLISRDDRKLRIEVGDGLEGVLTDARCSQIIRHEIVPRFRDGDYDGGVRQGINAILGTIEGTYTADVSEEEGGEGGFESIGEKIMGMGIFAFVIGLFTLIGLLQPGGKGWFLYVFLMPFWLAFPLAILGSFIPFIAYLILFPILKVQMQRNPAVKRWSKTWAPAGPFLGTGWSSGGWSSGGGGFSGGGGSFSGGGSSGSW